MPHSGVLLFVHAIADVPADGVSVVRGVRLTVTGGEFSICGLHRVMPSGRTQAETAAREVNRSENRPAGRAGPTCHPPRRPSHSCACGRRWEGSHLVAENPGPAFGRAGITDDSIFVSADDQTGAHCGRFSGASAVISDRR